jgi:protein-tyrosine phosphatase
MTKKILMVCHGNICRSPMAKAILIKKLQENKISGIQVDSAGTSNYHVGEAPDPRTLANGLKHGIDATSYRARQFKGADFAKYDRIYAMDSANFSDIMLLADGNEDKDKVKLFLEATHPGSHDSVPDPWYGNEDGFEKVFQILDKACTIIADKIKQGQLP